MKQYAFKSGKIQQSYLRKHRERGKVRKTGETSGSNSLQQSREEIEKTIEYFGKVVELTSDEIVYIENIGEDNGQSEVGVGQPIQSSREKRSKVRSRKSSSGSSSGRNGKIRKEKDGSNGPERKES